MRIYNIIDSLEVNGGSTMFLEMTAAMIKYWDADEIIPVVVSKSGEYGRKNLIDDEFHVSYGVTNLKVFNYDTFFRITDRIRDSVVFHHVLGHTKPMKFHKSCKYIVINHTMTNVNRLRKFRPFYRLVSVCKYFAKHTKKKAQLNSMVILNRIEDHYVEKDRESGPFIIGRCQRIVPSKYSKVSFKKDMFPRGYKQMIVGPINSGKSKVSTKLKSLLSKEDVLVGTVFNKDKKIELVRNFDVYLHNTNSPEGASMAVLEALSCGVPVLANSVKGGINDLIIDGVNGFFFKGTVGLNRILSKLQDPNRMRKIKASVREDFLKRLHIKHSLNDYRGLC